jgi:hypothetical protein
MVQPQYSPQEALERVKLMMKYDTSKTLNENREIIFEQSQSCSPAISDTELDRIVNEVWQTLDFMGTRFIQAVYVEERASKVYNNINSLIGKKYFDDISKECVSAKAEFLERFKAKSNQGDLIFGSTESDIIKVIDKALSQRGVKNTARAQKYLNATKKLLTNKEDGSNDTPTPTTDPYSKFQCVIKHRKAVKGKDVNGNDIYTINGVVYYGNGRKRLSNGTMANYTCNDPEFKGKSKPVAIPNELKDAEGVMKFQDWLDTNAAGWATGYKDGIIKKGENGGGYGKFGPRTQKAWNNPTYKDGYLKSLQTPTATTPDNTEGLADETEANSDQPF